MDFGLIGERLFHSFSKEVHSKIGRYDYILKEIAQPELDGFMRAKDFKGINVTIPYKQAVIPYLDGMSERAKRAGAVNTVVNRDGLLYGDNTDIGGMEALLAHAGIELQGRKVLILGTGGTSLTALAVAEESGAREAFRVSRTGRGGALTYEEAVKKLADAEVIINATPCGMFPNTGDSPIDISAFRSLLGVIDAIYNPLSTRLVLEAKKRGIKAAGGLYMLVMQAVIAAELFSGSPLEDGAAENIYADILLKKRNIVLTGMPGSGKSTVGQILAERLHRPFIDIDADIVNTCGMPITDIFKTRGEEYFRDVESAAIA
ncbi:MAG: shikimate dehydrogenase, partial [Clostridia bacterium]|nr:shikimate dehydrogenase [Clostridia bacterium]